MAQLKLKQDLGLQCTTSLRLGQSIRLKFMVTLGPYRNSTNLQFLLVLTKSRIVYKIFTLERLYPSSLLGLQRILGLRKKVWVCKKFWGLQTILGRKEIFVLKKWWVRKKCLVQDNFALKILGQKRYGPKRNFEGWKNSWTIKNF